MERKCTWAAWPVHVADSPEVNSEKLHEKDGPSRGRYDGASFELTTKIGLRKQRDEHR